MVSMIERGKTEQERQNVCNEGKLNSPHEIRYACTKDLIWVLLDVLMISS